MSPGPAGECAHQFRDPALLQQALTHRSFRSDHNERLEFLGDALLGFVIADMLYQRFPDADEGQLTRSRAALVNGRNLAAVARSIDLGASLLLGEGEIRSGGHDRDSILANALEALLAAIYLDGGMEACRVQVAAWFEALLAAGDLATRKKDPKTELQEYLQARRMPLPSYRTVSVSGPAHRQTFVVECRVEPLSEPVTASAHSRREGEQEAAAKALQCLRVSPE